MTRSVSDTAAATDSMTRQLAYTHIDCECDRGDTTPIYSLGQTGPVGYITGSTYNEYSWDDVDPTEEDNLLKADLLALREHLNP